MGGLIYSTSEFIQKRFGIIFSIIIIHSSFVVNIETKMGSILYFRVDPSKNKITRNHSVNGTQGNEEFDGGCAIQYDEPFEILIETLQGQFDVRYSQCLQYFHKIYFICHLPDNEEKCSTLTQIQEGNNSKYN